MELFRAHFGESVWLRSTTSGHVVYAIGGKEHTLEGPTSDVASTDLPGDPPPQEKGPFDRADFGDRDRLAWPAGACAIPQDATLEHWGKRFVFWLEPVPAQRWSTADSVLVAVDATRPLVVRIQLPVSRYRYRPVLFARGKVWFDNGNDVVWCELAALEALFDRTTTQLALRVHERYPVRDRERSRPVRVRAIVNTDARVHSEDGRHAMTIPAILGLVRDMEGVVLHDELVKDRFLEISMPHYPRRKLYPDDPPTEKPYATSLVVEEAVDPAGELTHASSAARHADLDRVFGLLADEPDDDASRLVIVDLLEDAGEPYAPLLARMLAGEAAAIRVRALGSLSKYLVDVAYRGGLPWAGTLHANAPKDDEIGDVVAADYRLGFFHTLRLGEGNFRVYGKLVASPRAVGLRHVDGSRAQILNDLIAGKRTGLRRLSGVRFATREVTDALADATFDSVVEIQTETQASVIVRLLGFIGEAAFFTRAPRHLHLTERKGAHVPVMQAVLKAWDRLPLAKLSIGGVTIARDGTATAEASASPNLRELVATRFRVT